MTASAFRRVRRSEERSRVPRARAAIVGTGNIAGNHVASLQALAGEAEVVAGVDVDMRRLAEFTGTHGIPGRYTDLARMLDAERPDLVHICTPPPRGSSPPTAPTWCTSAPRRACTTSRRSRACGRAARRWWRSRPRSA